MSALTYIKNGQDVKTSQFLRNRGSCCKTSCIHCPYGFTIEKEGIQFAELNDENFAEAKIILGQTSAMKNDVTADLLASAFGPAKAKNPLTIENKNNYLLVKIKNEFCAVITKNKLQISEIVHKEHFDDQGLTCEIINKFLISS